MRRFLLRAVLLLALMAILIAAGGVALATLGPSHPGSVFFAIQNFTEQEFKMVYRDPVEKANYLLNLFARRINDLNYRTGTRYEYAALKYLDNAINQATLAISSLSKDKSEALRTRLTDLAKQAEASIKQLKHAPIEDPIEYASSLAKVQTIQHMVGIVQVQNNELVLVPAMVPISQNTSSSTMVEINSTGGLIPWPPGSPGALHAFYPLTGKHAGLACTSCHNAGIYLGTANQCAACHSAIMPAVHYPGKCDLCHTTVGWKDVHFDHVAVYTIACVDCHYKDLPANHYTGACSACHLTINWTPYTFDHAVAGAVDCIACHANKAPVNHYPGQCSNCHITFNWTSVVFDHAGFTDCIACHASKAPANHYSGQCSRCHNTNNWTQVVFDHTGFTDCIACHANKTPAHHFGGQCSNCHVTSSWTNVHFDHTGFTDCEGCHSGNAPANHYPYQCSLCHNTSTWGGGHYDHGSSSSDCISCHAKDRPAEHDAGQCSNCHNTSGWGDGGGGLFAASVSSVQSFTCTVCHQTPITLLGEVIKQ